MSKPSDERLIRWSSISSAIDYVCKCHPHINEFAYMYGYAMTNAEIKQLLQLVALCRDGFIRPRDVSEY